MDYSRISRLLDISNIDNVPAPTVEGESNHNRQDGCYNSHYGKKHSDATKEVLYIMAKNRWVDGLHPRTGTTLTQEHKNKISRALKGRVSPRKGSIPWNKGMHHSDETKAAISTAKKGQKRSDAARASLSKGAKNRIKITCVHCNKTFDASNISRWHNDNCKHK